MVIGIPTGNYGQGEGSVYLQFRQGERNFFGENLVGLGKSLLVGKLGTLIDHHDLKPYPGAQFRHKKRDVSPAENECSVRRRNRFDSPSPLPLSSVTIHLKYFLMSTITDLEQIKNSSLPMQKMESIKVILLGKKCLGIIPYVGQHVKIFFEIPIV